MRGESCVRNEKDRYWTFHHKKTILADTVAGHIVHKQHRRNTILILAFLIGMTGPQLIAEARRDLRGQPTINYWSRYADVKLEIDGSRYEQGTAILVRYRIINQGYKVIRFYPSSSPERTFRFLVVDKNGREIKPRLKAEAYLNAEHGDLAVVNQLGEPIKEIILHPGEVFEKQINLSHHYDLQAGQSYRVSGYFWPDQREETLFVRSSNRIQIQIDRTHRNPAHNARSGNAFNAIDMEILLSPEETIYLFLSAEMRSNWNNYLKYLDLDRFITAYDRFSSRYVQANVANRPEVISDFKRYLISSPADRLRKFKIISSAPERSINGQIRQNGRYSVRVMGLREDGGFQARYEYVYTLEKVSDERGVFWKIIYVTAQLKNRGS